jgi:hypothetical protein
MRFPIVVSHPEVQSRRLEEGQKRAPTLHSTPFQWVQPYQDQIVACAA